MNACLGSENLSLTTPEETLLAEDMSPFDVPKSIVASYSLEKKLLDVHFKYITNESCRNMLLQHGIRASIGKNSHRLYALSLPMREPADSRFILNSVTSAIEDIPHSLISSGITSYADAPHANYATTGELLKDNACSLEHYVNSFGSSMYL